jgi:hypothetical protein
VFGWNGCQQAHGVTPNLGAAAGAALLWTNGAALPDPAVCYPFVKFAGLQLARERGDAVNYQWKALLEKVRDDEFGSYRSLVTAASRVRAARQSRSEWILMPRSRPGQH